MITVRIGRRSSLSRRDGNSGFSSVLVQSILYYQFVTLAQMSVISKNDLNDV